MSESVSSEISQIFSLSKARPIFFPVPMRNAGASVILLSDLCRKDLNSPDFPQISSKFEISQGMWISTCHRISQLYNPKDEKHSYDSGLTRYFITNLETIIHFIMKTATQVVVINQPCHRVQFPDNDVQLLPRTAAGPASQSCTCSAPPPLQYLSNRAIG